MPELGKATYLIEIDSREFHRDMSRIKKTVDAQTKTVEKDMGKQSDAIQGADRDVANLNKTYATHSGTLTRAGKDTDKFRRQVHLLHDAVGLLRTGFKLLKIPAMIALAGVATRALSVLAGGATALAGALGSATGGLVAMTASLGPLAGALTGVASAYGAMAQAMLTFKLAGVAKTFAVLSSDAEKAKAAMEDLEGPAKAFAQTLLGYKDQFDSLREVAGRQLFGGMTKGLDAAMKNFGALKTVIGATSNVLGNIAHRAGLLFGSKGFGKDFQKIGIQNSRILGYMGTAALNLVSALRHVLVAARPLVEWMGKYIARWSEATETTARAARESGRLARFFERTKKMLQVMTKAGSNLWGFLKQVGHLAFPTGLELWREFAGWLEKIRKWSESEGGKETIKKYFEHAKEALDAVMDVVGPFTSALVHIMHLGRGTGMDILDRLGEAARNFDRWVHSASGENKIREYFKDIRKPLYEAGRLLRDIVKAFFDVGSTNGTGLYDLLHSLRVEVLPAVVSMLKTTSERLGPKVVDILTEMAQLFTNMAGATGPLTIFFDLVLVTLRAVNKLLENKVIRSAATWAITFYGIYRTSKLLFGMMKKIAALQAVMTATGWGPTIDGKKSKVPMAQNMTPMGPLTKAGKGGAPVPVPVGGLKGRAAGALGVGGRGVAATGLAARAAPIAGALGIGAGAEGATAASGGLAAGASAGAGLASMAAVAGVVAAAIAALAVVVLTLKNNWLGLTDAINSIVIQPFVDAVTELIDAVSGGNSGAVFKAFGDAIGFVADHLETIGKVLAVGFTISVLGPTLIMIKGLTIAIKILAFIIGKIVVPVIKVLIGVVKFLIPIFAALIKGAIGFGKAIVTGVKWIVGAVKDVWKAIDGPLKAIGILLITPYQIWWGVAKKVFGFVKKGIKFVVEFIKGVFGGGEGAGGKVGKILGAPFRLWFKVAKFVFGKVAGGIKFVVGVIKDVWGKVSSFLGKPFNFLKDKAKDAFGWLKGAVKNVGGFFKKIFGGIGNFVAGAFDKVKGAIDSVVQFVVDRINNLIDAHNALPFVSDIEHIGGGGTEGGTDYSYRATQKRIARARKKYGPRFTEPGSQPSRGPTQGHFGGIVGPDGIQRFAGGGMVQRPGAGHARGGLRDQVPAWLEVGEMVLPKKVTSMLAKRTKLSTKTVTGEFGKEYKRVGKDTLKFAKEHTRTWTKLHADTHKTVTKLRKETISDFDKTHKSAEKDVDKLKDQSSKHFDKLQKSATKSTGKMKSSVVASTKSMSRAVTDATSQMSHKLDAQLKKLGVDPVNFAAVQDNGKGGNGGDGGHAVGAKRGAAFEVGGGGSGDTVPLTIGGRHVANVQPQEMVTVSHRGAAKTLQALNGAVQHTTSRDRPRKPKGYKKGGGIEIPGSLVAAYGPENIPPITTLAGHDDHVHVTYSTPQAMGVVGRKMQTMGWIIGEYSGHLIPGATGVTVHHDDPGHYEGRTVDANTAAGETHGELVRLAALLNSGKVSGVLGGGQMAPAWKNIPGFKLKGPAGQLRGIGDGYLAKITDAVNAYGRKHAGSGGYISGGGGAVEKQINQILFAQGWDRSGAAGIVGNAYGESNLNPGITGTGGGGLFGFTTPPVSLADVKAFAAKNNKPWDDVGIQMQFMLHGPEPGQAHRNAMNRLGAADAASYFMTNWERPGIPREDVRRSFAEAAFRRSQGATYGRGGLIKGRRGEPRAITAHGREGIFTERQMKALAPAKSGNIEVKIHGDIISDRPDPVEVVIHDPRFHRELDDRLDGADSLDRTLERMST